MKKILCIFFVAILLSLSVLPSFAYGEDYGALVLDSDTRVGSNSFTSTSSGYYARDLQVFRFVSGSRYAIYCSATLSGPGTLNLHFHGSGINTIYTINNENQPILISPTGNCFLSLSVYVPGDYICDYYITIFEVDSSDTRVSVSTLLSSYNVDPYNIPNGQSVYYKSVPEFSYLTNFYGNLFHSFDGFFESDVIFPAILYGSVSIGLILIATIIVLIIKRLRGL